MFTIDIKPEDIERAVTQAIVDSAIGKRIKETVDSALKHYGLEEAIREIVHFAVRKMVQDEIMMNEAFKDRLQARVAEVLTEQMVQTLINAAFESLLKGR